MHGDRVMRGVTNRNRFVSVEIFWSITQAFAAKGTEVLKFCNIFVCAAGNFCRHKNQITSQLCNDFGDESESIVLKFHHVICQRFAETTEQDFGER